MTFVANGTSSPVLPAIRGLIAGAEDVLLCSAFVDASGVMLLAKELRLVTRRSRLVATSVFNGGRTLAALDSAAALGVECRVHNTSRGIFHPKVLVARHSDGDRVIVGSANLTGGLVANVEAAVLCDDVAGAVRQAAEMWWQGATPLEAIHDRRAADVLSDDLYAALRRSVSVGDVVMTLGPNPQPNTVRGLSRTGVLVETARSRERRGGPRLIEPRMLQVAWDALRAEGQLTNHRLLHDLRVIRSSFVCAALATIPGVVVTSRRPITLGLQPMGSARLAADETSTYGPATLSDDRA